MPGIRKTNTDTGDESGDMSMNDCSDFIGMVLIIGSEWE